MVRKIDRRDDIQSGDPPEFGSLNFTIIFFLHDDGKGQVVCYWMQKLFLTLKRG